MTNVTQISLEALLLRATNCNNTNLDSAAVEAFFSLINKERDGPAIGIKVIAGRLPIGTEKEVLAILNILDMCMTKCGSSFQSEVGKFRFLNEMIKLVSPKYLGSKTPVSVKQRILQLLYLWTLDYPKEVKIKEAFDMLRKQGVIREIPNPNIPQEALTSDTKKKIGNSVFHDEEKSNILKKLLQSKDPEDIQAANWLIKSMVKEDEKQADLKSKAVSELESVQNNLRLLNEMMESYRKGVTTASELDLMKELYDNLMRLSPNLTAIACETDHCPADLMESVLKTIHDLTECLTKYKLKIMQEKNENIVESNLASLLELDQSAVNVNSLSLMEMEHHKGTKNDDCACSSTRAVDVLCDVFSGLGNAPETSDILQPINISSYKGQLPAERDKDKLKALEDLDVLGEHLLKEKLPSSNYRHQEKIPMNLLSKLNENKKEQTVPESNESFKLNLNYLIDRPSLNQGHLKTETDISPLDNADDCLVDITEDNTDKHNKESSYLQFSCHDQNVKCGNGMLNNGIMVDMNNDKGNVELNGFSKRIDGKNLTTVNVSTINLKDIVVKLEDIKPSSKKSIVALDEKNGITVLLHLAKDQPRPGVTVYVITTISRNDMPLSNYLFQAVVPKSCKLKLQSPSSTELPAFNPFLPPAAITQIMLISNPDNVQVSLKFIISYIIDEDTMTEMGEVEDLPLSE